MVGIDPVVGVKHFAQYSLTLGPFVRGPETDFSTSPMSGERVEAGTILDIRFDDKNPTFTWLFPLH